MEKKLKFESAAYDMKHTQTSPFIEEYRKQLINGNLCGLACDIYCFCASKCPDGTKNLILPILYDKNKPFLLHHIAMWCHGKTHYVCVCVPCARLRSIFILL